MPALLIFALTGAGAGLLAGLFGVGGGIIMVPALVFVLPHQGLGPAIVMQVALGTSLAVIAITSLSSTVAHHRRGGVLWPVFARVAPGLVLGALLGAFIAHRLSGLVLQRIVGVGAVLIALQMFLDRNEQPQGTLPGNAGLFAAGSIIGVLSSLIGVGGGSLTVPFLSNCGVSMRQAVGTAAAGGIPIAWAGAAGYMLAGANVAGRPEWSVGYVSLEAFAGLAVMSVLTAPLGAKLAHDLPQRTLKRAFALLLVVVGASLLLK
jgi:uncharacterized membrane protein YfcA